MKELPPKLAEMLSGFRASRILLTAVELDLFSALKGGAPARLVARKTETDERGVTILLDALASLGLIRKKGDSYHNSPATAEFLSAGGRNDWRLGIGHHMALWESWSHLTDVVKTGVPAPRPTRRSEARTKSFIGLMHQHGSIRAVRLAKAIPLAGGRTMLDVGGGSGAYSIAFARKNPRLQVTLLDVPDVIPITEKNVEAAGLTGRVSFLAGDLRSTGFGGGFDLVLVSAICHMLSPEENLALIRKAFDALAPGGRLLIHDFVLDETRTAPRNAAVFAVNMLVNTEGGNSYTAGEYRRWMKDAGFGSIRFRRLSPHSDFLLGTK
jgi:precorrin-6B methylase 2